jgi:bifunctional non-homologous end joining protein LigD
MTAAAGGVYKGLPDDLKPAAKPVASKRAAGGVPRENILQLLPDAVAPSQDELQAYWRKVEKKALEHLGRRPLKLVRNVNGTIFYHKGPLPPVPRSVHQLKVHKREGGEGVRLWVDDLGAPRACRDGSGRVASMECNRR